MKWVFPKALAIMTLAGFGIGMIFGGMHTYGGEGEIGFGAFLLLGAGFLYRGWFGRGYSPKA